MELGTDMLGGRYGLKADINDPFGVCINQKERVKYNCYGQMNAVLNWAAEGSLSKEAEFVEKIQNNDLAQETMKTIIGTKTDIAEKLSDYLEICRSIQARLHLACIRGLALAVMTNGTPDEEYREVIDVCTQPIMNKEERGACLDFSLKYLQGLYTSWHIKEICSNAGEKYKNLMCE